MEMDVVEEFHPRAVLSIGLFRTLVRFERSNGCEIEGGGRTGPVGGHKARA
jgi:hypothetical protein